MKIGIQGGNGSFNHQGWLEYSQKHNLQDWEIVFLHTTERVLDAIQNREIDKGQFGIYNTLGGLVEESAEQLGNKKFKIVDWYKFPIAHYLMKKRGTSDSTIKKIVAHPQGFKQCKSNLQKYYPSLGHVINSGTGIDPAKAAEDLNDGKLDESMAIIGPKMLAELYDLEIVKANMQDHPENFTSFVIVEPS